MPCRNDAAPDRALALRLRVRHGYTWEAIVPLAGYASMDALNRVQKAAVGHLNHKQRRNREALALRDQKVSLKKIVRECGFESQTQASNAIRSLRANLKKKAQNDAAV